MHAFLEDKQALELAWIGMHQSQGVGKGWGEGIRAGVGGMEISIKTLPPISLLCFQPLPSPTTSTLTLPNLPLLSKTEEIFTACLPENTAALQAKMMHKTFK